MKSLLNIDPAREAETERIASAEWSRMSVNQRAEFADNLSTFTAYKKAMASGRVRTLGDNDVQININVPGSARVVRGG